MFKENKLGIAIQSNTKIVDCLVFSINLKNLTCKPYYKSDNKILYIRKDSNQPFNILK